MRRRHKQPTLWRKVKTNDMKIEISIPNLGAMPGTCAWVADYLNNVELSYRKMKFGGTGLFYKHKEDKPDQWQFLGRPETGEDYGCEINKGFAFIPPTSAGSYEPTGMFDIPLTPAAKTYVREFISRAVDAFEAAWENDALTEKE